ncbi:MAG: class I SAM-dependent methyltransferase [Anaerolineales bacterium]
MPIRAIFPFLRVFFHLLYHQFAWTYDFVSGLVSIGMWNDWIKSILPDVNGQRVLELGHGPGHLQIALLQEGKEVVGIDLSPQMGKICRRRILKAKMQPELVNGSAQQLPFPDDVFDHIISTFPTEYIVAENTISEMHRVLRPGGVFLILPAAWITGRTILHKAAAWLFKVTGQAPNIEKDIYMNELKRFNQAGFKTCIETKELKNSRVMITAGEKTI